MKIAISNIAWQDAHEADIADVMQELGVTGVELAPTKRWPDLSSAPVEEVTAYRTWWQERGIRVVAIQALLYGRPDLTVFESEEKRAATLAYLTRAMDVARGLGAVGMVFGSPKNRLVGGLTAAEAREIAVDFFRRAGEAAAERDVVLLLEPNPTQYACEFVTCSDEGAELVAAVDHPGFALHLDAAGMTLAGEDAPAVTRRHAARIRHFHASEPFLGPLGEGGVDHTGLAAALRDADYGHWVSVEMRHAADRDTPAEIRRALELLRSTYGD